MGPSLSYLLCASVSRHYGEPIEGPLKPPVHHRTIVLRALMGVLNIFREARTYRTAKKQNRAFQLVVKLVVNKTLLLAETNRVISFSL